MKTPIKKAVESLDAKINKELNSCLHPNFDYLRGLNEAREELYQLAVEDHKMLYNLINTNGLLATDSSNSFTDEELERHNMFVLDFSDVFEPDTKTGLQGQPDPLTQKWLTKQRTKEVSRQVENSGYLDFKSSRMMTDEAMEEAAIIVALDRNQGNRKDAAKELGMSERTLYRRMNKYEIS